ncbi:MAG: hypothetical protein K8U57_22180 [Planctomycetes bacterium]|nr:hypothetical protein [Planctomycetota bacterium]
MPGAVAVRPKDGQVFVAGKLPLRVHGAYGSPELDRITVKIEKVIVSADGLSAELATVPLVRDRVYLLMADGVRSAKGNSSCIPLGRIP